MLKWLLLLTLVSPPARAQEIPACGPPRVGAVACLSGKLCACRFERGGSITGRADGHRWDCGALRPACGEGVPPAAFGAPPLMPELFMQVPPPPAFR